MDVPGEASHCASPVPGVHRGTPPIMLGDAGVMSTDIIEMGRPPRSIDIGRPSDSDCSASASDGSVGFSSDAGSSAPPPAAGAGMSMVTRWEGLPTLVLESGGEGESCTGRPPSLFCSFARRFCLCVTAKLSVRDW